MLCRAILSSYSAMMLRNEINPRRTCELGFVKTVASHPTGIVLLQALPNATQVMQVKTRSNLYA